MMRFKQGQFDRHLVNIGQQIVWRRAYACSCVNPASGNPDPKHAVCAGKGRIWADGVQSVVGIVRQETVAEWVQSGLYESGDMVLSIPQNSPMWDGSGQFDRVLMLNSDDVFSMPLMRGGPVERLLFQPVRIDRVFWFSPSDRNTLVEGPHPVVDAAGNLSWPNGGPPLGVSYSITGLKHTEYFIFGKFPSDRNQHAGMRLPKRVIARKWDLFGR